LVALISFKPFLDCSKVAPKDLGVCLGVETVERLQRELAIWEKVLGLEHPQQVVEA